MKIIKNIHKTNAESHPIHSESPLANRIGFWGIVTAQNSRNNTVDVCSDTGFQYTNIMVKSDEWVTLGKNYVPSERNLPPIKSRVFVLTPSHSISGSFVLCSGFSRGDTNIRTLWAQNENELESKNNSREIKTQGGWDITEEYSNGNYSAASNDGNIKFNVNTTQDDNKSQPKEVSVTAWNNVIIINEDGISITDKNNNVIETTDSGISITDKNGNIIESGKDSEAQGGKEFYQITVGNVATSASVVKIAEDKTTITVGNSVGTKIEATSSTVKINNHLEVLK